MSDRDGELCNPVDEKGKHFGLICYEESNTGELLAAVHVADSQSTMVQRGTVHWQDWTRLVWLKLIFSHVLLRPRS